MLVREDALVDDVGLAVPDRLGGRARGAVVVALRVGDLENGLPVGAKVLEVGALVLEPLAEDQLRLLVLDVGPVELPARVRERERRQVLAGQEGRDVGRRELEASIALLHRLSITDDPVAASRMQGRTSDRHDDDEDGEQRQPATLEGRGEPR